MTTEPAVDTILKLIPLAEIITNPANPRKDLDSDAAKTALAELGDSVAERGILHNLVVTTWKNLGKKDDEKRYMIIAGERRYRASLALIEDGRGRRTFNCPAAFCSQAAARGREIFQRSCFWRTSSAAIWRRWRKPTPSRS